MKITTNIPNLIAHRGLSSAFYDNTLSSFIAAGQQPFFGIETDIQFTLDNKMVCFHDKTTKKINGLNKFIGEYYFKDLIKLRYIKNNPDTTICPFKKFLKVCKKYKKTCVIEIKYSASEKQLNKLIKTIKFYRYLKNCIIISFNQSILTHLRQTNPSLRLQFLISSPIKRYMSFCTQYNIDASFYDRILSKEHIEKLHSAGLKAGVWVVNRFDNAMRFKDMGVDYITSNYLL